MLIRQQDNLIMIDKVIQPSIDGLPYRTYWVGVLKDINGQQLNTFWGTFEDEFRTLNTLERKADPNIYPLY